MCYSRIALIIRIWFHTSINCLMIPRRPVESAGDAPTQTGMTITKDELVWCPYRTFIIFNANLILIERALETPLCRR